MQVRLLILFFLFTYSTESKSDYDDFFAEEEEFVKNFHTNVTENQDHTKRLLLDRKHCIREETTWKCREECREQFLSGNKKIPGLCQKPLPGDVCFGSVVDFSYVVNHNSFPLEYQILENYPRCWSFLAPLLCLTHFRPCAMHKYAIKAANGSFEEGIVELWSRSRRSFCKESMSACSEVIRDGYFPDFIKCNGGNTSIFAEDIFSDTCRTSSLPIPLKFSSKCPDPLVFVDGIVHGAHPIHDSCYLRCRSEHVSLNVREHQMVYQTAMGLCLAIVFAIPSAYLYFCSEVHRRSAVVFCGSQAFICIALYYFVWATAFLAFNEVECIEADGNLLRINEPNTHFLNLCVAQSFFLHFVFTAAFLWLFAVSLLGMCKPKCLTTEKYKAFQLRSLLAWGIYFSSFVYSFISQQFHLQENDGVSGICFPGLQSSTRHLMVLLPLCLISVASCAFTFFVYFKRAKNFDDAAIVISKEMTARFEKENRARRTQFLQSKKVNEPTLDDLRNVDEMALVAAEINGDVRSQDSPQVSCAQTFSRADGFFSRIYRDFKKYRLNKYEIMDVEGAVTPSDALHEISAAHYATALCEKYEPYRIVWFNSFGFYSIALTSIFAVVVLSLSLVVHPFYISFNSAEEINTVRTYIKCALDSSLRHGSIEWIYHNRSDLAFSSCQLQSYLPSNRSTFVITTYLILPGLPFLVLVAAMVTGCCGRGGMKQVRKTRWSDTKEESCEKSEAVCLPLRVGETNSISVQTQNEEVVDNGNMVKHDEKKEHREQKETSGVFSDTSEKETGSELDGSASDNDDCIDEEERMDQLGELGPHRDLKKLRRNLAKERKRQHLINTLCVNIEQLLRTANPNVRVEHSFAGLMDAIQTLRKNSLVEGRYSVNKRLHTVSQLMATVHDYITYSKRNIDQNSTCWSFILYLSQNTMQLSKLLMPEAQVPPELAEQHREALCVIRNVLKFFEDVYPEERMIETSEMFGMWPNMHEDSSERLLKAAEHVTTMQSENNRMMAALMQRTPSSSSSTRNGQAFPPASPLQQASSQARVKNSLADRLDAAVCKIQHSVKRCPEDGSGGSLQPSKRRVPANSLSNEADQYQEAAQSSFTSSAGSHSSDTILAPTISFKGPQTSSKAPPSSSLRLIKQETAPVGKSNQSVKSAPSRALPSAIQPRTLFGNSRPQNKTANVADLPGPSGQQTHQHRQNELIRGQSSERVFATQSRTSNLTSPFDPVFCFAPHGLITTFDENSMSLRITGIRSLTLTEFYPQEIMYMLVLTGDMRIAQEGEVPGEEESLIQVRNYEEYFNTPDRTYPQVETGLPPFEFLEMCRRRAIIFVGIIGDWFNRFGKSVKRSKPHTIPAIDFHEWNQIETIRVMKTPLLVSAALEVLRRFENGRVPIEAARTEVFEIQWAGMYWDRIVEEYGFPNPERNMYVDDPAPSITEMLSTLAKESDEPGASQMESAVVKSLGGMAEENVGNIEDIDNRSDQNGDIQAEEHDVVEE